MNTEQERTYRQLTAVLDAGFLKVNSKLGDVLEQLKRTRTGIEPNDTAGDEVDEANRVLAWALEEAGRLHIDAVNLLGQQLSHAQSVKQAYLHGWAGHMTICWRARLLLSVRCSIRCSKRKRMKRKRKVIFPSNHATTLSAENGRY